MSTTYFPQRLVHAHLPPPPTIPNAIPELRVPTDQVFESDQQGESSHDLHTDHALSAIHHAPTGILARTIGNGHILELRSLRFRLRSAQDRQEGASGSEILRIRFPEALLPLTEGCIVIERNHRCLNILIVTESTTVYRLNFALGSWRPDQTLPLLFNTRGSDWCEEYEVPEEVKAASGGVSAWTVVDEDNVILGGNDGSIIKLRRTGERTGGLHAVYWTAAHHRPSAKFRLPSLFSRSATDEQVVSFAQFDSIIYALSRDRRLRMWNAETGVNLRTVDIRPASGPSQELVLRGNNTSDQSSPTSSSSNTARTSHIRILPHPDKSSRYTHLVIIFNATPYYSSSAGSFVVYRSAGGTSDLIHAGERQCSLSSAFSELRGMEIASPIEQDGTSTGWRLYAVWDKKGQMLCESVPMDDIFQFSHYYGSPSLPLLTDWQPAVYDHWVDELDLSYFITLPPDVMPDPNNPMDHSDTVSYYVSNLFQPGRFSQLTLSTALEEYIEMLPREQISNLAASALSIPTLRRRYEATVGCHIKLEHDAQTGAADSGRYLRELDLDWLGVWSRVKDLDKQARWAIGVTTVDGQITTIAREGIFVPVLDDISGVIDRFDDSDEAVADFKSLPEASLRPVFPSLASPKARSAALALNAAGSIIADTVSAQEALSGMPDAIQYLLEHIDTTLAGGWETPVESFASDMWTDLVEPYLSEEVLTSVRRTLSECFDVSQAISATLDILASADLCSSASRPGSILSGFGDALTASALSALILNRFTLAKHALLVTLFYAADSHGEGTEDDERKEETASLLSRCFVTYHRYRILRWVAEQSADELVERLKSKKSNKRKVVAADDSLTNEIEGLRVGGFTIIGDFDGVGAAYSLLHRLIAERTTSVLEPFDNISQNALAYLRDSDILDDLGDLAPSEADIRFANSILSAGLPILAGDFSQLYPRSAGLSYINGRAELESGQIDFAVKYFEQAAVGCKDGSISALLPACSGPHRLTEYYQHVANVFADRGQNGPTAHFAQLALFTAPKTGPATRSIWTRLFLAHVTLHNFEDAYTVMMRTPFFDLQRDFLGQLISVICEANEVGRLNQLGFAGLQKEVESLLSYKARNSDPLRFPNYYKVLYSWHVSRGDYRSDADEVAGEVMYQQGRRFADASRANKIPAFEIAAMQARSYLAAVNALSLVDKRNAWISVADSTEAKSNTTKRRRVSSWIPQDEFNQDKHPIRIITLADLELEYTLVLTRLRLSTEVPDLFEHGISIDAKDIVGMLVDRSMFDLAISSAVSMDVDMTRIFIALARKSVELSRSQDTVSDHLASKWLHSGPLTSRLTGPPAALALRYLQSSLEQHDSEKTNYRYRLAVSDALFEKNLDKSLGWQMPPWLVQWEMSRDPEEWISRAIKWGWVEEAIDWSAELLRSAVPPELLPKRANAADLPYSLFDRVIAAAKEGSERDDKAIQVKVKSLESGIARRIEGLRRVSGR